MAQWWWLLPVARALAGEVGRGACGAASRWRGPGGAGARIDGEEMAVGEVAREVTTIGVVLVRSGAASGGGSR